MRSRCQLSIFEAMSRMVGWPRLMCLSTRVRLASSSIKVARLLAGRPDPAAAAGDWPS